MQKILIKLIVIYQYVVSPMLGPSCRFTPSCSDYAIDAVRHHGTIRGLWLALRRLGKCHPWHEGGLDPVPAANHSKNNCCHHG